MQRLSTLTMSALGLLLPVLCLSQDYQPSFSWPRTVEEAKELTLTEADANALVNWGRTAPNPDEGPFSIVNGFTFAQLERDKLYFVAIADTGKGFDFDLLLEYYGSPEGPTEAVIRAVPPHTFSEELVDLDKNGLDEIVAKDFVGGYEGSQTELLYKYTIYKIVDGRPLDVSDKYKSYYETTLLPRMKANVIQLRTEAVGNHKELEVIDALEKAAESDYQRRVLKNLRAGLEDAKLWVHSDNERLRDYALQTLIQIDDPEADQVLAALQSDQNPVMAKGAKFALNARTALKHSRSVDVKKQ